MIIAGHILLVDQDKLYFRQTTRYLLWQLSSKIDFFHSPQNSAGSEPEASAGTLSGLCIYHLFQNRGWRLSQRQCHMLGINIVSALPLPSATYRAPVPCAGYPPAHSRAFQWSSSCCFHLWGELIYRHKENCFPSTGCLPWKRVAPYGVLLFGSSTQQKGEFRWGEEHGLLFCPKNHYFITGSGWCTKREG